MTLAPRTPHRHRPRGESCPPEVCRPAAARAESLRWCDFGRGSQAWRGAGTPHCVDLSTVSDDKPTPASAGVIGRRWLFPSALLHEIDPDAGRSGRPRRTARDWVVDFTCFLLAVAIGLAAADTLSGDTHTPHALAVVDQVLGALACAAVWARRRWPLGLAVAMIPVGFLSNTAGGAGMVVIFTLAVHRPFRSVAWIGG